MRLLLETGSAGDVPGPVDDDTLARLYAWPDGGGVRANFVSTLDGSGVGGDGRSGSINTEPDGRVFHLQRELAVAAAAGGVLKKCVLELGGADAYVVLEDADVEGAAAVAARARMVNGGQSCIAGKRFIVVRPVRDVVFWEWTVTIRRSPVPRAGAELVRWLTEDRRRADA